MMRATPDQTRLKVDQLLAQEDLNKEGVIDEASHFILRLSYCQNEELRKWFLQQEAELFKHRLKSLSDEQLAVSVKDYCQLKPISTADKEALAGKLQLLTTNPAEFATTKFYAVPFDQALDLVGKRECYLRGGLAYLPQSKLVAILVHKFRAHLSRCLALMGAAGTLTKRDDPESARIQPLLQNMSRVLVNAEPDVGDTALGQSLTAANVLNYKESMPLCMRQLQTGLQHDKKLKHWGRMQYGLFLKGAGLSMDDALAFFQRHFSSVTGEQFQKQYSYNIRHMYGKEGKRATYTPYGCSKIIMGNAPAAGDHHGCPYKHYDAEHLSQLLQQLKIGDSADRASIMSLKKSNQFQLACQKHFEVMHPGAANLEDVSLDNVGNHPNSWFRASVAYKEVKAGNTSIDVSP
jgi:DNA primase large subunit